MWTENDYWDIALSFQEKAGCDDIWDKICQVKHTSLEIPNQRARANSSIDKNVTKIISKVLIKK